MVGDIINLSTSQISIVPADMFLLSGDAIVNESMLTGESVPVSKVPAKDSDLVQWKEEKAERVAIKKRNTTARSDAERKRQERERNLINLVHRKQEKTRRDKELAINRGL